MIRGIQEQHKQLYNTAQQGAAQAASGVRVFQTALTGLSSIFGSLTIAAAAFKSINFLGTFSAWAESMNAVSKRTKIAVEDLNALERIIKQEEGSFEDFTNGLRFLSKAMSAANDPTFEQAKLFKQLNIDIKGGLMPTLLQLADRMKNNLSVEDQMGASLKLLGRGSENLVNFLTQGSAAIQQRIKDEKEAGVITGDFAKRVDDARDSWTHFKDVLSVKIGQPVIESISDIIAALAKLDKQLGISQGIKSTFEAGNPVARFLESLKGTPGLNALVGKPLYGTPRPQDPWADLGALGKEWAAGDAALSEKIKINTGTDTAAQKAAELLNKQAEALARLTTEQLQAALTSAQLAREQGNLAVDVKAASDALIDNETAAALSAAAHDKLGPAVAEAIRKMGELKKQAFDNIETKRKRKEAIDLLKRSIDAEAQAEADRAAVIAASARDDEILRQRAIDEVGVEQQLADLAADRLQMFKKDTEAEAVRLQARIAYLEKMKALDVKEGKEGWEGRSAISDAQILNAQTQLQKLGTISVNIGQHVGNTLNDIFTALITGTLKSVDIGKSALATLGRIVTDAFQQIIKSKLSFELDLFNNVKGLPGQMQNAMGSSGGFGGIISWLLYGSGDQGAEQLSGPPAEGGGGWGGILGIIGKLFGGGSGGGISGIIGSILGGSSGGSGGGGGGGGIIGSIFGGISNIWSLISNTQLGVQISAWVATAVANISTVVSNIATTVSSAVSSVLSSISWIPYIGWAIAAITAIYRIIANQQERPNAKFSGQFAGIAFDPESQQFIPGEINVAIGRKFGIKNSQAGQIATNLQQRLLILSQQWVDILNVFPDMLASDIIPALDEVNRRLNYNFANLKFSPGGNRNIQQELEAMSGPNGLVRMLDAFLPALNAAFGSALRQGGIPGTWQSGGGVGGGFSTLAPKPYWEFPQEDWDKFIQSLKDVAGITGGLAKTGAGKFLTPTDLSGIQSIFDQLFATSDVKTFTEMAGKIEEQLKPITDFLTAAVQQSTDLFGRGLIAAMEAATESDARLAFLNSLNSGIKDVVFNGLTEAFIASAQFGDLLAPIQQQIRAFVEQAITSGTTPDIAEFRRIILPNIKAITTRGELLGPLIDVLQELGFDIREMLGLLPAAAATTTTPPAQPTNVTIYVQGGDPDATSRAIEKLLRSTSPPA